jgi:sulfur carrier protein ThiS
VARIAFTQHLQAVGPSGPLAYPGATVAELLDAVAADFPRLKGYVLDDQGRVRKHIAIFVDGVMQPRERALALPVDDRTEVYVFQALSGG